MPNKVIPLITNDASKIQLARLGHVYFEHPDLEKFSEFATDFGFVEVKRSEDMIYYRGYGVDPYVYVAVRSKDGKPRFGGPAFVARSQEDFEKAIMLPGADLRSMKDAPGGGDIVTFNRPDDTFFHVIYNQTERLTDPKEPSATHEQQGPFYTSLEKPRRGKFQRYHSGPALVHKLGHFGYVVPNFDSEIAWYTNNFNFIPTDILYSPIFSQMDVLAFMHLDLGENFSDHHVFFMQRAEPHATKICLHHTSYEVADFDTQVIGHEWLAKQGWKSIWGVGRHILGSQIFDYWADPSGFKIEHYTDGDLVNKNTPMRRNVIGPFSVWGPELPKDFACK